jgi:hypothetical protein
VAERETNQEMMVLLAKKEGKLVREIRKRVQRADSYGYFSSRTSSQTSVTPY